MVSSALLSARVHLFTCMRVCVVECACVNCRVHVCVCCVHEHVPHLPFTIHRLAHVHTNFVVQIMCVFIQVYVLVLPLYIRSYADECY